MAVSQNVGELVSNDKDAFRAFAVPGFRNRKKKRVEDYAYYRRAEDEDGISLGLTPDDAVSRLNSNHGYCQLSVGEVHKLPYKIEIRLDNSMAGHAFICHVPFIATEDDAERERAILIAGALARLSTPKSYDHYPSPDLETDSVI